MSKARNQACVQLVGLGDQALGVAKRLDAPRIDHENVKSASISAATSFRP